MYKKTTDYNCFENVTRTFAPAKSAAEACNKGTAILNQTARGDYKDLDRRELIHLLKTGLSNQMPEGTDAEGFINLDPRGKLPDQSDAYLDVIMFPSYALAAIGVYAMNTYPEVIEEELCSALKAFMDKIFAGQYIYGHGYEASDTTTLILEMFGRSGARRFTEDHADFSENFTLTMKTLVDAHKKMPTEGPNYIRIHNALDVWDNPDKVMLLVFVYGTLMKGQRAYDFLEHGEFLGTYLLRNYAMYDLGSFPGIIEQNGQSVVGEVYRISSDLLGRLDSYEGEGSLYRRATVTVCANERTLLPQAYVYKGEPEGRAIEHKWNAADTDRIWYASYGSSMSRERFNCYVYGGTLGANHREYVGCKDHTDWEYGGIRRFPGRLYFGNNSISWENKGVAFYDPDGSEEVIMRLYGINMGQLNDIRCQEGPSDNWYGRIYCLGIHEDGRPIYTLTSAGTRPKNLPSEKYVSVIKKALMEECGKAEKDAEDYLQSAMMQR